ncbi:GNAT family N-acetyltransferase [Thermoactinospora rubra]|uniref:GNAT family N-acetyltransferase n=1 Tax=Thermoactinospora rubra TaxID=1088767 RepID=UPI000A106FA2|nr:GNAT family N-acetyltransferase [Thermoactinospora rubra]
MGDDIVVRLAAPGDAAALLELQHRLDRQTEFMLLEPGERDDDPGPLAARLADTSSYVVVAMAGTSAAGYVEVSALPYARARRTGYVVMGVSAEHAGRGLGRALLQAAVEEARARGLARLELTVMEHNRRALNLYLGCGFQVEGLRRDALDVAGVRVGEYYMGLLLKGEA